MNTLLVQRETFFGSKTLTTSDALTQELGLSTCPEIFSELALDGFFAIQPLWGYVIDRKEKKNHKGEKEEREGGG